MLFVFSKMIGYALRLETLIVVLLVLAIFLRQRRPVASGRAVTSALTLIVIVGILPVGDALLLPLERRFERPVLPGPVDGIIILGGAEDAFSAQAWGIPATNEAGERIIEGAQLARRFPAAKIIVSGGAPMIPGNPASGGEWMARMLTGLGVDRARIIVEGKSRNTVENVRLSRALVDESGTWIVVTSAFHMPRTIGIFRRQGWDVLPWPVDYRSGNGHLKIDWDLGEHLGDWNTGMKEWVGLVSYRLLGRTDALFPGP